MNVGEIKITKKQLMQIPEEERIFFLQILNLFTEINIFQKLTLYTFSSPKNVIAKKAKSQMNCNLLFVLAGKLYEGWGFISKGSKKKNFFIKYPALLNSNEKKCYKDLKRYFNKENIVKDIRNNVAFHYNGDHIKKQFNNSKIDEFELYLPVKRGEMFSTASYFTWDGLFNKVDPSHQRKALDKMGVEVAGIATKLSDLLIGFIQIIFDKYPALKSNKKLVKVTDPKHIKKMHLTLFTRS